MGPVPLFFTLISIVVLVVLVVPFFHGPWFWWRIVGLVTGVVGMVMLAVARYTLGNSFSIAPEARKLVTAGIYSKIRNPVYVFGVLGLAGLFVYMERPALLLLFVIVIPLQIVRARAEAKVLEAKFGDEYRRYRAQTWF